MQTRRKNKQNETKEKKKQKQTDTKKTIRNRIAYKKTG